MVEAFLLVTDRSRTLREAGERVGGGLMIEGPDQFKMLLSGYDFDVDHLTIKFRPLLTGHLLELILEAITSGTNTVDRISDVTFGMWVNGLMMGYTLRDQRAKREANDEEIDVPEMLERFERWINDES